MTNVKVQRVPITLPERSDLKDELQLVVEGHAGYDHSGHDIVCAAESILVQSFATFLAGAQEQYVYDFSIDGLEADGCVAISAIPTHEGWDYIRGAFECTAMGFYLLAGHYPDHVNINVNANKKEA